MTTCVVCLDPTKGMPISNEDHTLPPLFPLQPTAFPRCPRCHVPQYQEQVEAHQQTCQQEPRTGPGRPRKYPAGYKKQYRYTKGGARRGASWQAKATIGKLVEQYGPLLWRGEPLYPLRWIAA